jgi:hypothetical protein
MNEDQYQQFLLKSLWNLMEKTIERMELDEEALDALNNYLLSVEELKKHLLW